MKDLASFHSRHILRFALVSRSGLSIGARASLMPTGSELPVVKRPDGLPIIPGSSLKGVLRSFAESVLRTIDKRPQGRNVWACDPLDEGEGNCVPASCPSCNTCGSEEHRPEVQCCPLCKRCKTCLLLKASVDGTPNDEEFTRLVSEVMCTACSLFGSRWTAGRVHVRDAVLANGTGLGRMVEIRDGVGIDRDLGAAREKVKYDFEAVPPGARFDAEIVLENAEPWEAGLVLATLRAVGEGLIGIGGKTTRGLGRVEVGQLEVFTVDKTNLLDWLAGGSPRKEDPAVYARAFRAAFEERTDA